MFDKPPAEVRLDAYLLERGGNGHQIIAIVAVSPDRKRSGVPVKVHTVGTQGVLCLMRVPDWTDDLLREVIAAGPYVRRRKHRHDASGANAAASVEEPMAVVDDESAPDNAPEVVAAATEPSEDIVQVEEPCERRPEPVRHVNRLTPLEKLRANDIGEEEIERLKATMASIVYREVGEAEVPDLLQVSVGSITEATLEHMKLPKNETGTYRGIIANFYVTRIALFGVKWEDSLDPDARYTDWLIDAKLVLDFVGGKNELAALTRVRNEEVKALRRKEEEEAKIAPPPTAEVVEEAVLGGFTADAQLLDMVAQSLRGLGDAEEGLTLAIENSGQFAAEMARLESELATARKDHEAALELVTQARARVKQFTLTSDLLDRIREVKRRFDLLMQGLGI